jgi:hypothetical protein
VAQRDDDKLVRQLSLVAFLMAQQRPVTAEEIHEAVEGYGGMSEQAFLRRFFEHLNARGGVRPFTPHVPAHIQVRRPPPTWSACPCSRTRWSSGL